MDISVNFDLKLSKAYKEHVCFQELEEMKDFYDCVFNRALYFRQFGTKEFINYEAYVFLSMQGTLDSIKQLLLIGRLSDATVLVRKYFDDILAGIYLKITLKDKLDIDKSFFVEEIQKWIDSKHRLSSLKCILQTIKTSDCTKKLYPFFGWNTCLEHNRQILDDCVHANGYSSMLLNCNTIYLDNDRERMLDTLMNILKQLMTIQVAFIFHLSPDYMIASEYIDYKEMNMEPPIDSEFWISRFAYKAYVKYIKPHVKLAEYIKESCSLEIE